MASILHVSLCHLGEEMGHQSACHMRRGCRVSVVWQPTADEGYVPRPLPPVVLLAVLAASAAPPFRRLSSHAAPFAAGPDAVWRRSSVPCVRSAVACARP